MAANPKGGRRKYSIRVTGTSAKQLQANHQKLWFPEKSDDESMINALKTLVDPIKNGLLKYYENVEIKVVDKIPDMSAPKDWGAFKLASKGISGNTRLADIGGVPYMNDPKYHHITFQLTDIVKVCGLEKALVIGAGAASPTVVGKNAELMPNTLVPGPRHTCFAKLDAPLNLDESKNSDSKSNNESKSNEKESKSSENDSKSENKTSDIPFVGPYPSEETGCLANLFLSDGKQGPSIYLKVGKRKVDKTLSVSNCIREALCDYRTTKKIKEQIGMGGIFKVNKGKIKAHIMPDFANYVLTADNVENWLEFFEMGPELVMFSTLITGDPTENNSMHLRVEHTHFHSTRKKHCHEGGHYHYDVVKDIEYEGYFNLAQFIYRVEDAQYNIDNGKKK